MKRLRYGSFRLLIDTVWVMVFFIVGLERSGAAIHIITFAPFAYSPNQLSCAVGDTIRWQGDFSFHPLASTTIPAGASSWSATTGTVFDYIVPVEGTYNYQCNFHGGVPFNMTGSFAATVTDVKEAGGSQQPASFYLEQNYPNPFNSSTIIRFTLPSSQRATLTIYDVLGHKIAMPMDERREAGRNVVQFDAGSLATGLYLYSLQSKDFIAVRKFILMK